MRYQRCLRCVMDNKSDKTIKFDRQGYCNYCTDVLKRMPTMYFPNKEGKRKLEKLIKQIKLDCKEDKYDCLIGVSGGVDSSYLLYLGYQYGLRMLAVHIDDGLDNPIATQNIKKLVNKTGTHLITVRPDHKEYADLLKTLFKASVPNLAFVQDNLIVKSMDEYGRKSHIKYLLDGNNIAHESILERSNGVDFCDKKHIIALQNQFGEIIIRNTKFISLIDRYIKWNFMSKLKHIRPLNYLPYNLVDCIKELEDFCDFQYYGGKHYESVLTRFLQCYYLPVKFGIDKRKSHYSSLIVSGQMTRDEALQRLKKPLYSSNELLQNDKKIIADFMSVSVEQLEKYISLPPKRQTDYPYSVLNRVAPLARKFRKFLE